MVMASVFETETMLVRIQPGVLHCHTCDQDKSEDNFPWKNKARGKRSSRCKLCGNLASKAHYTAKREDYYVRNAKRKALVTAYVCEYKERRGCLDCKRQDLPHYALDLDHQRDKLDIVSRMSRASTLPKVKREIKKCEVVCATCHRLRHPPLVQG
jgi:hypothetical protein